jgi:DNA topoisomerase-1
LQHFYFGDEDDDLPGLKRLVEENLDEIDAAEINTFPIGNDPEGREIVVKPGKYGPYVKRGEDTASVPDDLTPDELTVDMALKLLAMPKSDEPIGELDGYPVFAKNGRYGPYVQWGTPDNLPPGLEKPRMASLFKTMVLERLTVDEAEELLQLPDAGRRSGRWRGDHRQQRPLRTVCAEGQGLPQHHQRGAVAAITLEQALEIFSQPRCSAAVVPPTWRQRARCRVRQRSGQRQAGVAKDGKFGVYVTDGETNASLSKGDRLERCHRGAPTSCWPSARGHHRRGGAPARRHGRPRRQRPRRPHHARRRRRRRAASSALVSLSAAGSG